MNSSQHSSCERQIFAAEAVAVLAACFLTPELIQGRELVWFIDNEAALSSLIRGTSRAEDVGHIAACTQVAMLERSSSVWYEWVDSDSNPADGLSRDGVHDKWALDRGWHLTEFPASAFTAVAEYFHRPDITVFTAMAPEEPNFARDPHSLGSSFAMWRSLKKKGGANGWVRE